MGVGLFGLGVVVRISLADSGTAVARRSSVLWDSPSGSYRLVVRQCWFLCIFGLGSILCSRQPLVSSRIIFDNVLLAPEFLVTLLLLGCVRLCSF
ncbi:unnamed protein product [Brassica oleracea]